MPLPFFLGALAAAAGIGGVASGVSVAKKMKDAKDTMALAKRIQNESMEKFDKKSKKTNKDMDKLGKLELNVLKSFEEFANTFEKIQNRPSFDNLTIGDVKLPEYSGETIRDVSVGAGVLLGGLGGAAAGTAGGIAAAGATTAAVMALGSASTGTAIASLSGAAAVNATLAALGGGAIAAGGGGIALGTTILGAATAGVGLLVGGVIFNITGNSLSEKADEAYSQARSTERKVDKICNYLSKLSSLSNNYRKSLDSVNLLYKNHLERMRTIVDDQGRTDWNNYDDEEKKMVENTVLLVGLLYNMCKVQLVLKGSRKSDLNKLNTVEAEKAINDAEIVTREIA